MANKLTETLVENIDLLLGSMILNLRCHKTPSTITISKKYLKHQNQVSKNILISVLPFLVKGIKFQF